MSARDLVGGVTAVLGSLVAERSLGDPQALGGPALVATFRSQGLLDGPTLQSRDASWAERPRGTVDPQLVFADAADCRRQICGGDLRPSGENQAALDDVLELADIARVLVTDQESIASRENVLASPSWVYLSRKCSTRRGISPRRTRRGGISRVTTASR